MFVEIVNLTDGPGKNPTQVDIYNRVLGPGEATKVPAELVNSRLRALADAGLIAIGPVPSWYSAAKINKSRVLSSDEIRAKVAPKNHKKVVEEKKEDQPPPKKWKKVAPVLELVDTPTVDVDEVKIEKKG